MTVSAEALSDGIALSVSDAFAGDVTAVHGAAGLGLEIVTHAGLLLGGQLFVEQNRRGIVIPYPI